MDLRDQRQNGRGIDLTSSSSGSLPFIKWPGGKRWLAPNLAEAVESELEDRYVEPFLGGGAVFFALEPARAVLSDLNPELIDLYSWVKRDPNLLVERVWRFSNTAECFYRARASKPRTSLGRAARMLYLSRTSFGGIYRLNKSGENLTSPSAAPGGLSAVGRRFAPPLKRCARRSCIAEISRP